MLTRISLVLLACLSLVSNLTSAQADEQPRVPDVLLSSIGQVERKELDRLQGFLSLELECNVRVLPDPLPLKSTLEEQVSALAEQRTKGDAFVVCLMNVSQDTRFATAVMASQRVALINVRYENAPTSADPAATEHRLRRMEEDTIRAIAKLEGLTDCPLPLCALHFEQSTAKSDEIHSRNLCPPCQGKSRQLLRDNDPGIPADKK